MVTSGRGSENGKRALTMFIDIFNTERKYNIIYADPPWTFKTYSEKGKEKK